MSPDRRYALGASEGGTILRNLVTGADSRLAEQKRATSCLFSRDGDFVFIADFDGTTILWDTAKAALLCRIVSVSDGSWVVVDQDGHFDANDPASVTGFSWVFSDDLLNPTPPEILLRDFYEPSLLPRILSREVLPRVPSVAGLNRVQPGLEITGVEPGPRPDLATVTVRVTPVPGRSTVGGRRSGTDGYDLRLFRDGRLVGRWPEPREGDDPRPEPDPTSAAQMTAWREANRVVTGADGTSTRTITVRLPHRAEPSPMKFTAYAFNEDRVKSPTVPFTYQAPANPPPGKPRAYLICVGVGASERRDWDLAFAAADARLVSDALGEAIGRAGRYRCC